MASSEAVCGLTARPVLVPQLPEHQGDELGVPHEIPLEEAPGFLQQTPEPLQPDALHRAGGATSHACYDVEGTADTDDQVHVQG